MSSQLHSATYHKVQLSDVIISIPSHWPCSVSEIKAIPEKAVDIWIKSGVQKAKALQSQGCYQKGKHIEVPIESLSR